MASAPAACADALLGALVDRPSATAAELADTAGIGRSTAGKLLAKLTDDGRVERQPGGRQHGRRTADRWTLTAETTQHPSPDPAIASAPTAEPADADGQSHPGSERLRAGELRDLALDCLADRPGQPMSPTAIAKVLGRSAGAVSNAVRVLAGQGAVVQTQAKPRRYAIADRDQVDATR